LTHLRISVRCIKYDVCKYEIIKPKMYLNKRYYTSSSSSKFEVTGLEFDDFIGDVSMNGGIWVLRNT